MPRHSSLCQLRKVADSMGLVNWGGETKVENEYGTTVLMSTDEHELPLCLQAGMWSPKHTLPNYLLLFLLGSVSDKLEIFRSILSLSMLLTEGFFQVKENLMSNTESQWLYKEQLLLGEPEGNKGPEVSIQLSPYSSQELAISSRIKMPEHSCCGFSGTHQCWLTQLCMNADLDRTTLSEHGTWNLAKKLKTNSGHGLALACC